MAESAVKCATSITARNASEPGASSTSATLKYRLATMSAKAVSHQELQTPPAQQGQPAEIWIVTTLHLEWRRYI